jgi:hypothetical protein
LRARIDDDAKDGAGQYFDIRPSRPTKSASILAATPAQIFEYPTAPLGLARVLAHGFVARLANIGILAATRFAP